MLKKALKKLSSSASRSRGKPSSPKENRLLTAEGWKRLMMKKYRK